MASPCCNGVDYRKRFNSRSSASESSSEDSSSAANTSFAASKQSLWCGDLTVEVVENLFSDTNLRREDPALALVCVHGEWNAHLERTGESSSIKHNKNHASSLADRLQAWLRPAVNGLECQVLCGKLLLTVDSVDELTQLPPAELPVLALVSQKGHTDESVVHYLPIRPAVLQQALCAKSRNSAAAFAVKQAIQTAVHQVESDLQLTVTFEKAQAAIRIFVAGDRSSVGKSSVCL